MFDAGSIQAHLDIDQAKADAQLKAIEKRVAELEKPRKIRISAVFDNSSTSIVRRQFAQLDNLLSRDAMQRLRSSPQGSVLGTLNALFSPHPVTGAPSAAQSASQGLLGKMVGAQGGASVIRNVAAGQQGSTNTVTTKIIKDTTGGQSGGDNQALRDAARDIKGAASDVKSAGADMRQSTDDLRNTSADLRAAATGIRGLVNSIHSMTGSGTHIPGGGGGDRTGIIRGTAGGIGPGVLGMGVKSAGILAGAGSLLGALPALAAVGGTAGVLGIGAGFISAGAKQLIGQKNTKANPNAQGPLYDQAQAAKKALDDAMTQAAAGMLGPLREAFKAIPGMISGIAPALKSAFAGAGTLIMPLMQGLSGLAKSVLPLLGQAFRAVAPLVRPLIDGLGKLLSGFLPGLITLLKAAGPAVNAFAQVLGTLGKDLGSMFSAFAPVIKASATIMKALLDVVSALFPVIGKLAQVFASALAPVISSLAGILKALMPVFEIIGKVIADLAGAVLGDLVSAFGALAQLVKAVSPALQAFATALSGVFTLLENSGVFATFGDALENVVPLIGQLVSAILNGLTPLLPPLIQFFTQISNTLIGAFSQALAAVLPPLTELATKVLTALAQILPVILPPLSQMFGILTGAAASVIQAVADALGAVISAIPQGALTGIVAGFLALFGAFKLYSLVTAAVGALSLFTKALLGVDLAAAANPIGLVVVAIAALGAAFYLAWQKSAGFRDVIKTIGSALLEAGIVVVQANKVIIDSFLSMVGTVLHAAADAFGWVPGLGDKLRSASAHFDDFKAGVDDTMNHMISTMQGWQNELTGTTSTTEQATQTWISALNTASATIITDLTNSGMSARNARDDVNNLTTAIEQNGSHSQAAQGARQALIRDLERAGLNAQQATRLVDNLTGAVSSLHGKNIQINMTGDGKYSIAMTSATNPYPGGISGRAARGMYVTAGTTPTADDVMVRVSKGELILPAKAANDPRAVAVARDYGVPGYASGGKVGASGGNLTPGYITGMYDDFQKQMTASMVNAMRGSIATAKAAATAAAMSSAAAGKAGAGVQQWRGLVLQALKMLGLPASLVNDVLYQMQTESGGNSRAINLSDSNAARGTPSKGLMQVIDPTFASYHVPGTSWDIYDPLANIAAALNYAKHNKGFGSGPGQVGSGHGYALGGIVGDDTRLPRAGGWMIRGWDGGRGRGWDGASAGWWPHGMPGGMPDRTGILSAWWPHGGGSTPAPIAPGLTGSGGGFGLTRADLGLPATLPSSSGGGGASGGGADSGGGTDAGGGTDTGTPAPSKPSKPALNAAQKAAIAAVEHLMGGYIRGNKMTQASQANAILTWLGVGKYSGQLGNIRHLDSLLAQYRKKKNTKAAKAVEQLLRSVGVHSFTLQGAVKGNAPQEAAVKALEHLMKSYISANNMTGAGQDDALLTHLGVGKYTPVLAQIRYLDKLLAQYKKKKDKKDIAATETLLRQYGVRHFYAGGVIREPVTGIGASGQLYQFGERGPERITSARQDAGVPGMAGSRVEALLEQLIAVSASLPHGMSGELSSALAGSAQSASFRVHYPKGGGA